MSIAGAGTERIEDDLESIDSKLDGLDTISDKLDDITGENAGKVIDIVGNQINPATKEKQDDTITQITTGQIGDGQAVDKEDSDGTVGTTKGSLMFVTNGENKARPLKTIGDNEIKVVDLTDRDLQEAILTELKLISKKLDCLQPDDEPIDIGDLDSLEQ